MRKKAGVLMGSAALVLAVTGTALAVRPPGPVFAPPAPEVAASLRTELTPLIRHHLETRRYERGIWGESLLGPGSRTLCEIRLIQTRAQGPALLAGVHALCEEFTARDAALLTGGGFAGPVLVELKGPPDGRTVTRVEEPEEGVPLEQTVGRAFTEEGAAELDRIASRGVEKESRRLVDRARRAYGLPPDAPVRPG